MARRVLMLAASLAAASTVASGYAHWTFFSSRSAPFTPAPAMFNPGSLTNNTVSYFISDQGPGALMPGDSEANLVSQIQAAANVWNQVPTSTIRLTFGGYSTVGTPQATPGIDIIFNDDIPPGLLAFTSLTLAPSDIANVANGAPFVPIRRSTITLPKTFTTPNPLASYDDLFFVVAVHEFGHALGLQHTLTSGMMATQVTSASTKAAPLSQDDIAGISLLYPAPNYTQNVGTIQGTVAVNGAGVNMANVVALSANGTSISTLTNPDGTYQIQGVPPGPYFVYASPLPPQQPGEVYPDNVIPSEDPQGNAFAANTGFDTEFFQSPGVGTRNPAQAGVATVSAGAITPNVNFNLQSRPGPAIGYLQTYASGAYGGQVYSPFLYPGRWSLLLKGPGFSTASGLTAGATVTAIGAASVEPKSLTYYGGGAGEVTVDVGQVQAGPATPVALAVTLPNDMYVLPSAFFVVPDAPPFITGITAATGASGATVNLAGANLNAATTVVFDGAPAQVLSANSDGSLTVAAPPASPGYTAYVEALSTDGQTSWQDLGSATPPSYTYSSGAPSPSILLNSALLLPGTDSMVDIIGNNTSFVNGQVSVSVGLGSSDIVVNRVWVLNPIRIQLNVTVSPSAQPGPVDLTVVSGLQEVTLLHGQLQVQTANANQMTMRTPILNPYTLLAGTPAGGTAMIPTVGVPLNLAGWQLLVDFNPTTFQMGGGGVIQAQIPPSTTPGAATVQLIPPSGSNIVIPPVVMQVDLPPPVIVAASSAGTPITASNPLRVGDSVTLTVTGLTQSTTGAGLSQTQVTVGGVAVSPLAISSPLGQASDTYQIQFTLNSSVPSGPQQLVTVGIGTRVSDALPPFFNLNILPAQQ